MLMREFLRRLGAGVLRSAGQTTPKNLLPIAYVECEKLRFARVLQLFVAASVAAGPPHNGKVFPESVELAQSHVLQRYCVLLLVIRGSKTKLLNQAVTCLTEAIL
jgi:hypothetical protein